MTDEGMDKKLSRSRKVVATWTDLSGNVKSKIMTEPKKKSTKKMIITDEFLADNVGIAIDKDKVYQTYAANIGKFITTMTEMEKRQAFLNAMLEKGRAARKFGE